MFVDRAKIYIKNQAKAETDVFPLEENLLYRKAVPTAAMAEKAETLFFRQIET